MVNDVGIRHPLTVNGWDKNCFNRPTFAKDSRRQEWNTINEGMLWQTYESVSYAYLTNAPAKDRILPIFVLRRELKKVLGMMMLHYLANDSSAPSSSIDKEDSNFILLELACGLKS